MATPTEPTDLPQSQRPEVGPPFVLVKPLVPGQRIYVTDGCTDPLLSGPVTVAYPTEAPLILALRLRRLRRLPLEQLAHARAQLFEESCWDDLRQGSPAVPVAQENQEVRLRTALLAAFQLAQADAHRAVVLRRFPREPLRE